MRWSQTTWVYKITEKLQLDKISDRNWMIMACSAKKNEGMKEGFEWAIKNMKQ